MSSHHDSLHAAQLLSEKLNSDLGFEAYLTATGSKSNLTKFDILRFSESGN